MRRTTRPRCSTSNVSFSKEHHIHVAIRSRPLNAKESGNKAVWKCSTGCVEELKDDGTTSTGKRFSYDNVFGPGASTQNVYEALCKEIVEGALEGYNGTIFAYGQTSSGKTFTLLGSPTKNPGVSLLAIDDVFRTIQYQGPFEWTVHASYIEIYNETITDLLHSDPASGKNLKMHEDKRFGPRVKNVTEQKVSGSQECVSLFMRGEKNRHYAATGMNDTSSRSHTIFQIRIASKSIGGLEQDESLQKMRSVASEFASMQQNVNAEHATLYIVDQEHQQLHSQAGDGVVDIPISKGLAGACASDGKTLNISDVHSDQRFDPEYDEHTGYRCQNTLIVPVKSDTGEILAVAQCINKKAGDAFTKDDEARVESFAECISPLIQACKSNVRESRLGVLNLVDLAGSERTHKTGSTGSGLKEAGFINKSLMTLGSCISILAEGKQQHVPFRDSKLTILLSSSLGGNARTAIICAISPATRNRSETMSTLQFATRAKKIINKVQQNTRKDQSELVHLYMTETENLRTELGHMKAVNKWQVAALKASLDVQKKRHSVLIESLPAFRISDELREKLKQLKSVCSEAQNAANGLARPGVSRVQLCPLIATDGDDWEDMRLLVEVKRVPAPTEGHPVTWISGEELRTRLDNLSQMESNNSCATVVDAWASSMSKARPEPIELVALDSDSEAMEIKAFGNNDSMTTASQSQASASYEAKVSVLEPKASSENACLYGQIDCSDRKSLVQRLANKQEPTLEDIQKLRVELATVMKNLDQLAVELDQLEAQKRKDKASGSSVLDGTTMSSAASIQGSAEDASDLQLSKLHNLLQQASSLLRNTSRSTSRTSKRSDSRAGDAVQATQPRIVQGTRRTISPQRVHPPGIGLGRRPGASPPRVRHTVPCVASVQSSQPSSVVCSVTQSGQRTPMSAPMPVCAAVPQRARPLSASSRQPSMSRTITPIRYVQDHAVSLSPPVPSSASSATDATQSTTMPTHERSRARVAVVTRVHGWRDDSTHSSSRRRLGRSSAVPSSGDLSEGEFVSQLQCLKKELDSTLDQMRRKEGSGSCE